MFQVDKIASDGIKIDDVLRFGMHESVLKGLEDNAIHVSSKQKLDIIGNELSFDYELANSPIVSKASNVNISDNTFDFLNIDILGNMLGLSNGSKQFLNNIKNLKANTP